MPSFVTVVEWVVSRPQCLQPRFTIVIACRHLLEPVIRAQAQEVLSAANILLFTVCLQVGS